MDFTDTVILFDFVDRLDVFTYLGINIKDY